MTIKKLTFTIGLLALLSWAFVALDAQHYLNLDYIKNSQAQWKSWVDANAWLVAGSFFGVYVLLAAASFPGAAVMTLAAGALFGLGWGTLIVSFASSLGATLAFLVSRWLLQDWVQKRFATRLQVINSGVEREGALYLFTLRLVSVVPFFVINLAMGVTKISSWTFYWVSQLGMLAGTLVFVNAGTQLAQVQTLSDVASWQLLLSFTLLGFFPWAAKKFMAVYQSKKVYAKWKKPKRFDTNLVVIGGGSAGLVTAYIAAAVKAKVTLVEQHRMGGDCLNTGCVPSKALIRSAKLLAHIKNAGALGMLRASAEYDFAEIMERVQRVVAQVEPHDSVERYTQLGVDVVQGQAKIISPWQVAVTLQDGSVKTISTRSIVIATGARPFVPDIAGLDQVGYLTSDTLWSLRELPQRLVVLGGGPIGTELAQAFVRLGSQVAQVEMAPRILMREDPEVSSLVTQRLQAEGVVVLTNHMAKRVEVVDGEKRLIAQCGEQEVAIAFDAILVAVGRTANLNGFGLEELGVSVGRTVQCNEFLQTNFPNIYAAGDVAGPYQFTHTAAHQAWYAAVNALFPPLKKFKADYRVIPWATFVEPEVARVGLNEQEAQENKIAYEVSVYQLDDLDRAIADGTTQGFIKVLTVPGKDKILGVTIVGEHAADLIAEYVLAMKHNIGLNKILGTIHIYPTLAEANKYVAGVWKRAHAPQKLLAWVERFHAWRR